MRSPIRWARAARTLARTYGARGLVLRAAHEARRATGLFRTAPRRHRPTAEPLDDHPFRVDAGRLADATDPAAALARADRVVAGEYEAYRWDWRPLPASPADWLRHPGTGRARSGSDAWWRIPHLDTELGDIKDVWEPARFAWAYNLVRGYLLTSDDRYARAFHERFAEWSASARPFRGPHWSCGQESSIRAAALLYAEANLGGAPSSTRAAMGRLAGVLAATGERVDDAIGYAISQRNNHAISEATGLILVGARFKGRHPRADRWLRRGHGWLERLVREQFAEDGWYIQHSFNYMRLALDQCVIAERALRGVGRALSADAVGRVSAAVDLLGWVMEPSTGTVPNHGANDGAFVHPVTLADYPDFRPTLTAVCATFDLPLPGGVEPDVEALAWLGLEAPTTGPEPEQGVRVGSSGWAAARVGETSVFLRAGSYDARPGHIDPLHLDVRLCRRELLVDPGTFAYTTDSPWDGRLAGARFHNGPLLDGREPAEAGPRFLWLSWPTAAVIDARWDGYNVTLVAERPGRVRRRVRVGPDSVTIRDESLAEDAAEIRVGWLLHPDVDPAVLETEPSVVETDPTARVIPADPDSASGWFCPAYGRKLASHLLEVKRARPADLVLTTTLRKPSDGWDC